MKTLITPLLCVDDISDRIATNHEVYLFFQPKTPFFLIEGTIKQPIIVTRKVNRFSDLRRIVLLLM